MPWSDSLLPISTLKIQVPIFLKNILPNNNLNNKYLAFVGNNTLLSFTMKIHNWILFYSVLLIYQSHNIININFNVFYFFAIIIINTCSADKSPVVDTALILFNFDDFFSLISSAFTLNQCSIILSTSLVFVFYSNAHPITTNPHYYHYYHCKFKFIFINFFI